MVGFAAARAYPLRSDKPSVYSSSKETLDVIEYRAIAIGFPLFTTGALVAGAKSRGAGDLIFVSAVLTLFANLIFGGLHSYGV